MPIIDAYNTLRRMDTPSDNQYKDIYAVEQLLAAMDEAGVEQAVTCSPGQQLDNEYIAECQGSNPERIVGFAAINPYNPGAAEEVRRCAIKLGLRGLMLAPALHGYHFVNHSLLDSIFGVCGELSLPILVDMFDATFVTPLSVEEIVRGFPRTHMVITHANAWNAHETLLVIRRNHNIHIATSGMPLRTVQLIYRQIGPQHMLMSSAWPDSDFELERLKLRKAIPNETDRALVEGGNLAKLLGM